MLHDNYEDGSYFIEAEGLREGNPTGPKAFIRQSRWQKDGKRMPLWCDDPQKCLERNQIPAWVFAPDTIRRDLTFDDWIEAALDKEALEAEEYYPRKEKIKDWVNGLKEKIANYNLPFLSLEASTDKDIVLDVFINMNTNGKPLSQYDIIAAQLEEQLGMSLTEKIDILSIEHPLIAKYCTPSDVLFNSEALIQGYTPTQNGVWRTNKDDFVKAWDNNVAAIEKTIGLLRSEGIVDGSLLPTLPALWVITAVYRTINGNVDEQGKTNDLLHHYLWRSFFTHRYDKSANTAARQDYTEIVSYLRRLFAGENVKINAPIFNQNEYPPFEIEELVIATWPTHKTVIGRSILALSAHENALDFATGEDLEQCPPAERHHHHIYPKALLEEQGVANHTIALNCALIKDSTNWDIGCKDPCQYLQDRRRLASEKDIVNRLESHLIPVAELQNQNADNLLEDYNRFIQARASLIREKALELGGFER